MGDSSKSSPAKSNKMRNIVIASALGGLLVSGACLFMTGSTLDRMKEQAVTAMTNMPVQASADAGNDTGGDDGRNKVVEDVATTVRENTDSELSDGNAGSQDADAENQDVSMEGELVGSAVRNGEKVYIVKWGDTLSYLSAETGYSVDALADLNEIRDVDLIYADSALRIPGA